MGTDDSSVKEVLQPMPSELANELAQVRAELKAATKRAQVAEEKFAKLQVET